MAAKPTVSPYPSVSNAHDISKSAEYDLYGGQGNVNDDQGNDYKGTTPVKKASPALKALKNLETM
jgi:hypothetical protein